MNEKQVPAHVVQADQDFVVAFLGEKLLTERLLSLGFTALSNHSIRAEANTKEKKALILSELRDLGFSFSRGKEGNPAEVFEWLRDDKLLASTAWSNSKSRRFQTDESADAPIVSGPMLESGGAYFTGAPKLTVPHLTTAGFGVTNDPAFHQSMTNTLKALRSENSFDSRSLQDISDDGSLAEYIRISLEFFLDFFTRHQNILFEVPLSIRDNYRRRSKELLLKLGAG